MESYKINCYLTLLIKIMFYYYNIINELIRFESELE